MDKSEGDFVVIDLQKKLSELPHTNPKSFMYKVPKLYRKMNETMYTPQVISIGPFHHGQPELKAAEQYKLWALRKYLTRANMRVEEAMHMAYSWDEKARSCYAYPIKMNKHEFTKMMLLDGCFILEFMKKSNPNYRWSLFSQSEVERDLTMFENQLPFFVLQQLYDKSSIPKENEEYPPAVQFMQWMAELFTETTALYMRPFNDTSKVRHLVDLLRLFYYPSDDVTDENNKCINNENADGLYYSYRTPTISTLYETGIKVKRAEEADRMMDFSFKNGVLKIPPFTIHNNFEIQIRNLIASENFSDDVKGKKYVFHYLLLLNYLIKSEQDVSILVKEKIITNNTDGSDQQVLKLIHNLYLITPTLYSKCYFDNMRKDLEDYCNQWSHRSMASIRRSIALLKRDYFSSPWASISCLAAIFLLILTCLQTIFSAPYIFHK